MNPQSLIYLIKLMLETGALSPVVAPATKIFEEKFEVSEKKVGDYCESGFGLPVGTYCHNNIVTPKFK
jgi:hypothetical protein